MGMPGKYNTMISACQRPERVHSFFLVAARARKNLESKASEFDFSSPPPKSSGPSAKEAEKHCLPEDCFDEE
jgi:hypothetical protein